MARKSKSKSAAQSETIAQTAQSDAVQLSAVQLSDAVQSDAVQLSDAMQLSAVQLSAVQLSDAAQSNDAAQSAAQSATASNVETTKSTWGESVAKARVAFAKRKTFREGTNRAVIYALLEREGGCSLAEASAAIKNTTRKLNSLYTDFHDIASITGRKLRMSKRNDVAYYSLATVQSETTGETAQSETTNVGASA